MLWNWICMHVSWISLPPAPPQSPEIISQSVDFGDSSFAVTWRSRDVVDGFDFSITPSDLHCTVNSMTATCLYNMSHWGRIYNYTVAALNCDTQRGNESTNRVLLEGMSLTINTCYFYQCTEKARYLFSYDIIGKKAIEKLVGMLHLRTVRRTNLPHVQATW